MWTCRMIGGPRDGETVKTEKQEPCIDFAHGLLIPSNLFSPDTVLSKAKVVRYAWFAGKRNVLYYRYEDLYTEKLFTEY